MSTRRGWVIGAVVAVVGIAAVIAVVASGGSGGDDSGSGASGAKHETGSVLVEGTPLPTFQGVDVADKAVGLDAPTLVGTGFDGDEITITATGTPQVVIFLAHWCPHCQNEVPRVVTLAKAGAFDDLDVASVATGTSSQAPNYPPSAWLARERWPFRVMVDDQRASAASAYGLSSYPYFVFLDGNGTVLGRAIGEIEPSQLERVLDAMRAGTSLPSVVSQASSAAG